MPTARMRMGVVALGGKIYTIGGGPGYTDVINTVEMYDPSTDSWQTKANVPLSAIGFAAAAAPDGKIYVFGGYFGCCGNYSNTTYVYDPIGNSWSTRAPMPTAREGGHAALAPNGKIYVIGGNSNTASETKVEEYDPVANTWAIRAPLPYGVSYAPAITGDDGLIYVIDGATGYTQQYDPTANTWNLLPAMPTSRNLLAAAAPGDGRIYAFGGRLPSTPFPYTWVSTNEALELGSTPITPAPTTPAPTTPAEPQGCLYFDGNSYGRAVDDLFAGGYQWPFTMEAWVKTTNHTQDKGGILNKEGFWTEIRLAYADLGGFYATDNPSQHYEGYGPGGGSLPDNTWTHVAVVGEGTSLRLFKNGVLVSENTSVLGPPYWGSNPPNADRLKVGMMIWAGSPFYYYGWMTEVRVSNSARYSGAFTPSTLFVDDANTELLLHFDEGSGSIAYDSSGNGHHFDLTNPQWETCALTAPAPTTPAPTTPAPTTPAPTTPGPTTGAVGGVVELMTGRDGPGDGMGLLPWLGGVLAAVIAVTVAFAASRRART